MEGDKFDFGFRQRVTVEGKPGLYLFLSGEEHGMSEVSAVHGGTEEGWPEIVESDLLRKAPNLARAAHS